MVVGYRRLKKSVRLGSLHSLCLLPQFQALVGEDAFEPIELIHNRKLQEESSSIISDDVSDIGRKMDVVHGLEASNGSDESTKFDLQLDQP